MRCERPEHGTNPGILDFQDAVSGPITYDLASLVMDARTTWEEPQQIDWAIRYWELARKNSLPVPADFADFHQDYEWMGLQRNLRILGVFARLNHRDGKAAYLAHIPRVNQYVRQVAGRYIAFKPLLRILDELDHVQTKVGYTF
jgi:aminoglycoside/choline kinase family phosphotransferase